MVRACVAFWLVLVAAAGAHPSRAVERRWSKWCSQAHVRSCVRRAALHWRVDYGFMLRLAYCESRLDPFARNPSGASGLFQVMPGTWQTTPYRRHWIFSARYSALAAAWMLRAGRRAEWAC